jgi:hypothetical protein
MAILIIQIILNSKYHPLIKILIIIAINSNFKIKIIPNKNFMLKISHSLSGQITIINVEMKIILIIRLVDVMVVVPGQEAETGIIVDSVDHHRRRLIHPKDQVGQKVGVEVGNDHRLAVIMLQIAEIVTIIIDTAIVKAAIHKIVEKVTTVGEDVILDEVLTVIAITFLVGIIVTIREIEIMIETNIVKIALITI